MARVVASLRIAVGQMDAGTLSLDENGRSEFRLLRSYQEAYPRPLLGQVFLDDPDGVMRSRARVPAWFSNLLPEGALRELLLRELGFGGASEFLLLAQLGHNLPGAVVASLEEGSDLRAARELTSGGDADAQPAQPSPWHFSLAGVQLKLSATRHSHGLTIAASRHDGDWILKFADRRFKGVPENEHATMTWARRSGIDVPETALHDIRDVMGLPPTVERPVEATVLAVRRFDRGAGGTRIHMEDFAQLVDVFPEQKYQRANYETLAALVHALSGPHGLEAFVRRLVFMMSCGNGDAHLKNWSLVYADGVRAELSPAYDLVSTVQYLPDDRMALNLARSKEWSSVTIQSFRRLAERAGAEQGHVERWVNEAAEVIWTAWRTHSAEFGYATAARETIERHAAQVPLIAPYVPIKPRP